MPGLHISRILALAILALCLPLLSACGSSAGSPPVVATKTATPKPAGVTPTTAAIASPTAAPADTATPATPAVTATHGPSVTPSSTPALPTATRVAVILPPRVLNAFIRPSAVAPGASLLVTVMTSGTVKRVEVYLGSGSPTGPAPSTFTLFQSNTGQWTASGKAPSVSGEYHFTVGLFNRLGGRIIVDNDAYGIRVTGSTTGGSSAVQPFPADIPLAPPYSYGNPVSAVFSAEGKTVSGSEVVSTTRTDVTPGAVAQYYETHLPRAGWTVNQSTIPVAGAASFSISATSGSAGSRVCVIQFSSGTVHIFYGSTTA